MSAHSNIVRIAAVGSFLLLLIGCASQIRDDDISLQPVLETGGTRSSASSSDHAPPTVREAEENATLIRLFAKMDELVEQQAPKVQAKLCLSESNQTGDASSCQPNQPNQANQANQAIQSNQANQGNQTKETPSTTKPTAAQATTQTGVVNTNTTAELNKPTSRLAKLAQTLNQKETGNDVLQQVGGNELVLDDYAKTLHEAYKQETDPTLKQALLESLDAYLEGQK